MKEFKMIQASRQQGFTLIELSIVLVIIGLIVGGVLVGQDLIKTAQIRATITQIGQYNAAVNSFHAKYNGLPGDLINPANYFGVTNSAGTQGLADNNGLIESSAGAAGKEDGETVTAWYELNQANLVGEAKGELNMTNAAGALPGTILPPMKIGRGSVAFRSGAGNNYWELGTFGGTEGAATLAAGLSPVEALALDNKMDDGLPATGTILAIGTAFSTPQTYTLVGVATLAGEVAGNCSEGAGTAADIYATANQASSTGVGCSISIRGSY